MHYFWVSFIAVLEGLGIILVLFIVSFIVMVYIRDIIKFSIVTYFAQKEAYVKRIMPDVEQEEINKMYH